MLWAGGCRTTAPGRAPERGPALAYVVRVNAEQGFAVLDCLASPRVGEDLTVWRGERRVALVRASARRRGSFVAADIIAGEPQAGDLARGEGSPDVPRQDEAMEMRP